jgi:hypothetical protein
MAVTACEACKNLPLIEKVSEDRTPIEITARRRRPPFRQSVSL